jgi:hypothetical protein
MSISSHIRRANLTNQRPTFGSLTYARERSHQAFAWAQLQEEAGKYAFVDPPEGTKLPTTDDRWDNPTEREFSSPSTGCAHAMFRRECVLYNEKNRKFIAIFTCKNEVCSRRATHPFIPIRVEAGYTNLMDHARGCYGDAFDKIYSEARAAAAASHDVMRAFMARRFHVVSISEP